MNTDNTLSDQSTFGLFCIGNMIADNLEAMIEKEIPRYAPVDEKEPK
jgi:hypothetical protein